MLVLLSTAACNVQTDQANEQVTVEYNKQEIREKAAKAGRTAKEVASGVGNVAVTTGRAIKNEVGDVDVDVDVRRTPRQSGGNQVEASPRVAEPGRRPLGFAAGSDPAAVQIRSDGAVGAETFCLAG
jgi:hypothetical protein